MRRSACGHRRSCPGAALAAVTAAAVAVVLAVSCHGNRRVPTVELFHPPASGALTGIVVTPAGEVWLAERDTRKLGRFSARRPRTIEEFEVASRTGTLGPPVVASDGTVWAAEVRGDRLVGIDPRNPSAPRVVSLLTTYGWPWALAAAPDGALFVALLSAGMIVRAETGPAGGIREFPLPAAQSHPGALAATPDGRVWFALEGLDQLACLDPRRTPALDVRSLRTTHNGSSGAAVGPDGNVWFTFAGSNRIVRVTPQFLVTEFPLPTPDASPRDPVAGTDGAVWFLETKSRRIGRIEVAPPYNIRELELPGVTAEPQRLAASADGDLFFLVPGANAVARLATPRALAAGARSGQAVGRAGGAATYTAPTPPAPTGSVGVIADEACTLNVDGTDFGRLRANDTRIVMLPEGRRLVAVKSDLGASRTRVADVRNGESARILFEFRSAYVAADGFVPVMPALRFAEVPAGEFLMGTDGWEEDQRPAHRVRISRPFALGVTEVTQGQWLSVMGKNPTSFESRGDDRPIQNVSWDDAQAFLERLNRLDPAHRYRLPTEAEWEYAARAGGGGECPAIDSTMGWFGGEFFDQVHPVATKNANAWGIYDLVGNAGEWCADRYGRDTYRHDAYGQPVAVDPAGPDRGSERVYRGFRPYPGTHPCWVAGRWHFPDNARAAFVGFRVVREER